MRPPTAPEEVLGWYLSMLRNSLAHREVAHRELDSAEVAAESGKGAGAEGEREQRMPLRRIVTMTAEDVLLIDLFPLAKSPSGIVEVILEAWKAYSLDVLSESQASGLSSHPTRV